MWFHGASGSGGGFTDGLATGGFIPD